MERTLTNGWRGPQDLRHESLLSRWQAVGSSSLTQIVGVSREENTYVATTKIMKLNFLWNVEPLHICSDFFCFFGIKKTCCLVVRLYRCQLVALELGSRHLINRFKPKAVLFLTSR